MRVRERERESERDLAEAGGVGVDDLDSRRCRNSFNESKFFERVESALPWEEHRLNVEISKAFPACQDICRWMLTACVTQDFRHKSVKHETMICVLRSRHMESNAKANDTVFTNSWL